METTCKIGRKHQPSWFASLKRQHLLEVHCRVIAVPGRKAPFELTGQATYHRQRPCSAGHCIEISAREACEAAAGGAFTSSSSSASSSSSSSSLSAAGRGSVAGLDNGQKRVVPDQPVISNSAQSSGAMMLDLLPTSRSGRPLKRAIIFSPPSQQAQRRRRARSAAVEPQADLQAQEDAQLSMELAPQLEEAVSVRAVPVPEAASEAPFRLPSFCCPVQSCQAFHASWATSKQLYIHIEREHLQHNQPLSAHFLEATSKWVCPRCRVLVAIGAHCRSCAQFEPEPLAPTTFHSLSRQLECGFPDSAGCDDVDRGDVFYF